MEFSYYLKLIRWKNLVFIAYTFYLLKFQLFQNSLVEQKLTVFQFLILLFSVLLITAAGYIFNDINDVKADLINKPNNMIVSTKINYEKAHQWYKITNTIGVVLGISLCLQLGNPSYSFFFIVATLLLYYYSKYLKGKPLIGNLLVSTLISISIFLPAIFDLNFENSNQQTTKIKVIVFVLAFFSFCLNLIREIIKDIEDINGDFKLNLRTFPILFGRDRSKKLAIYLCAITLFFLTYMILTLNEIDKYLNLYVFLFVVIPLLYTTFKIKKATTTKMFHKISMYLKIIMFLGVNTLLFLSKNY